MATMQHTTDLLRDLRIASPCHVDWDQMTGDERSRFCSACSLHVYNLSEMTGSEIRELIVRTEGRLCGRLYRRADGTLITRDCPVGLKAFRKRVSLVASAVFATVLSSVSVVFGQTQKKGECKQIPALTIERKSDKNSSTAFNGTVTDPLGASVARAKVTLLDGSGNFFRSIETNESGEFSFVAVPDGYYTLEVTSPGFKLLSVKKLELHGGEVATAKVVLDVGEMEMGVIVWEGPMIESGKGSTVIRGDVIRKLPINE